VLKKLYYTKIVWGGAKKLIFLMLEGPAMLNFQNLFESQKIQWRFRGPFCFISLVSVVLLTAKIQPVSWIKAKYIPIDHVTSIVFVSAGIKGSHSYTVTVMDYHENS